jgi:hypothetical protein
MLAYAGVCWRVLACAGVCMLTYADVCRYEAVPMASRSVMRDMTLMATKSNLKDGNDFPLFSKGQVSALIAP